MKKFLSLVIALAITASLAGCGAKKQETLESTSGATVSQTSDSATKIKVGASSVPHSEILEVAKPLLAEKNIELEIIVFDDYVLPNMALEQGDLDANYFQHKPYLTFFNENNKTNLVPIADIHYEPFGIYPGKGIDLAKIENGAKIGVPNDGSNEARALYLLEEQGLITVNHEVGFEATPIDITKNEKNLEIIELDADKIPSAIKDLDFAVINGNYAIASGINETVLVTEDSSGEAASTYANVIAVKAGNEENAAVKELISVLASDEVKNFIKEKYKGSVVSLN